MTERFPTEKALADSKKDSADRLAAKEASIRTLLVKGIFDSSAFLKDKTVLPSDVAYASFGKHFEVKEENGELRVVATMNGQPIFSRSDPGTFAAPEEALEAIIDKYPMKDRILKAPDGGSGSHPNSAYAPGAKIIPKGDLAGLRSHLEAIALTIIAKGEVTVRPVAARTKRIFSMNDLSKVVRQAARTGPACPARHLRHAPPRELGLQQPCRAAGGQHRRAHPLCDQGAGRHAGGHFAGHGRHLSRFRHHQARPLDGSAFLPDRQGS